MELYVAIIAPVVASIVTYLIAKGKQTHRRDTFYENKISAFMEIQERKINELTEEVSRLTAINLELLEKVIHLEGELSKHDAKISYEITKH